MTVLMALLGPIFFFIFMVFSLLTVVSVGAGAENSWLFDPEHPWWVRMLFFIPASLIWAWVVAIILDNVSEGLAALVFILTVISVIGVAIGTFVWYS